MFVILTLSIRYPVDCVSNIASQKWSTPYDHLVLIENLTMPLTYKPSNVIIRDIKPFFNENQNRRYISSKICREYKPHNGPAKRTPSYRTMCYFWFAEFVKYTNKYSYLLRIDSDCLLLPKQIDPFLHFPRYIEASAYQGMDYHNLIFNMKDFYKSIDTINTVQKYWENWKSPYTNVMYINLSWTRSADVQSVIKKVNDTNCIFWARWGDLPLWGATMHLLNIPLKKMDLNYYHRSLNSNVLRGIITQNKRPHIKL